MLLLMMMMLLLLSSVVLHAVVAAAAAAVVVLELAVADVGRRCRLSLSLLSMTSRHVLSVPFRFMYLRMPLPSLAVTVRCTASSPQYAHIPCLAGC